MTTTHTPGPWTLETVRTSVGHCHQIGPFPGSCGRKVGYACVYVDGQYAPNAQNGNEKELLANARLIASAPDTAAERDRLKTACEAVQHAIKLDDPAMLKVAGTLVDAALTPRQSRGVSP